MTLVKKQYNGRELPVFENMDEATEHFARRRKTIYKGINALLSVFGLILGIIVVLFHPSLVRALVSIILLAAGSYIVLLKSPKFVHQKNSWSSIRKKRENGYFFL